MASIRDSVIDQFGNAVPGALVVLISNDTGSTISSVATDGNGFFEFNNLVTGSYRLQISGANLTTRIITPIYAINPYPVATQSASGLMSAADKAKLDGVPSPLTLESLSDVTFSPALSGGEFLTYNSSGYWYGLKAVDMPFPLKSNFTTTGGTSTYSNKYPQLNTGGLLSYSFLNVTPVGGAGVAGLLPVLNVSGKLDPSLYDATQVGGTPTYGLKLVQLPTSGMLDTAMINTATVGGASSVNKIPKLNASGRIDPSMLPTSSGTFRGSLNLTIPYVAPGWASGDYGASSTAGTVHATWQAVMNDPIPTTVKVGDNVYYTGGKYSVVPSTVDMAAYLPRDGTSPMTGQLSLIDQTSALPTGVQAVSRTAADKLYMPVQIGALPSVTQITSKATSVSINATTGKIVMHNASLPAAAMAGPRPVKFSMVNTKIVAGSVVLVNYLTGGTTGGYRCWAGEVVAGSCNIYVENISGAPLAQPITLQFQVMVGGL